jgi:hypothetical protein
MRWERDDNSHTASLEAIQARRRKLAAKLGEAAFAYCDEDMEIISAPEKLSPRQQQFAPGEL